jgi:hypothetical protein
VKGHESVGAGQVAVSDGALKSEAGRRTVGKSGIKGLVEGR